MGKNTFAYMTRETNFIKTSERRKMLGKKLKKKSE